MRYINIFATLILVFMVASAFSFIKKDKDKEQVVYAYGVATSFRDTVVYITEIQVLDSAKLDKDGFLPQRNLYPYQLKNYLENKWRAADYTCTISFSKKKETLTKDLNKLQNKLKKNKDNVIIMIPSNDFKFTKPEE
ncbi:MAG: hypothetical protein LBN06_04315 [Prevotellaceae bacterium]|nr:hypothetical protein [Prevotellaceae bacterium]